MRQVRGGWIMIHKTRDGIRSHQILVQKVFERDLSCDGRCKKLKF